MATLTQTLTYSAPYGSVPGTVYLTGDQFDDSLGVLTAVGLSASASYSGTLTAQNLDSIADDMTAHVSFANVVRFSGRAPMVAADFVSQSPTISVPPSATEVFTLPTATGAGTVSITSGVNFDSFHVIGGGGLPLLLGPYKSKWVDGSANPWYVGITGTLSFSLTITYTYTPQPSRLFAITLTAGGGAQAGQPSRAIAITLSAHAPGGLARHLSITLSTQKGRPSRALSISQTASRSALGRPLAISLSATGRPERRVRITLLPYAPDAAQLWQVSALVGGVDVSARLTGAGSIEAEEGGARIADLRLLPGDADVDPAAWVGLAVAIDLGRVDAGAPGALVRRFTGVVDVPSYDPSSGITTLRCTDDLQAVVGRLSQAQIAAILPGSLYSPAIAGTDPARVVFYSLGEAWSYAQERAATLQGHLDLSPQGAPRWTPWVPKASPDITYDADTLNDGSLTAEIAHRSIIRNSARITFTHRFPRCKCRHLAVSYTYPFSRLQVASNGYSIPTRAMTQQALAGTGWTLAGAINYVPLPGGSISGEISGTTWTYSITDQAALALHLGFSASLAKRYVQWVDSQYHTVLRLPGSVAALGEQSETLSGALAVTFDAAAWEANTKAQPLVTQTGTGETWVDYYGAAGGLADAATARAVLEAKARASIIASHRRNTVRAEVDFDARLDLTRAVRITTPRLSCTGKVRSVRDAWDMDRGTLATSFSVALRGVFGNGVPPQPTLPLPSTPPTPPAGPFAVTAGTFVGSGGGGDVTVIGGGGGASGFAPADGGAIQPDWFGYFCNVGQGTVIFDSAAPVYPVQFTLRTPAIEPASRDNLVLISPAVLDIEMASDPLTLIG